MAREHQAWLAVVQQLKRCACVIDINEEPALHAAITLWGETLYDLRRWQDGPVCRAAYEEAVDRYAKHIGFLPSTW